jgi:hypothetical protein
LAYVYNIGLELYEYKDIINGPTISNKITALIIILENEKGSFVLFVNPLTTFRKSFIL